MFDLTFDSIYIMLNVIVYSYSIRYSIVNYKKNEI